MIDHGDDLESLELEPECELGWLTVMLSGFAIGVLVGIGILIGITFA